MADDSNPFAAPTKLSNVVLIVDGKKVHVYKEFLAAHSDFFYAMFFGDGDFVEKGKEEVEIKDVVFEEFIDLLKVIHPGWTPITANSVAYILKLADQFQMKDAREQSVHYLMKTKEVDVAKKLLMADLYNLPQFRDLCLESFTCPNDMSALKAYPEYARFSDAMRAALWDKVMELFSKKVAFGRSEHNCRCK